MKRKIVTAFLGTFLLAITSCTDLEEKYGGNLTESQVANDERSVEALLINLDNSLKVAFQNPYGDVITLSEITTDELIAPTRGTDWFDNGMWQQLHQHRWNGDHILISGCFNDLNGVIFAATDILRFSPTPAQESKARFYRALAMYWLLDFFDQVPYRDPGESTLLPARVRKGIEALEYIISEINDATPNLPDGPANLPNKDAARVFLMKCYLNKGVYTNRQSPTFSASDMNEVIKLADEVINSNRYSFSNNYFDNFAPGNTTIGKENIFTQENVGGISGGSNLLFYIAFPLHYSNTPFGPNGWATLSDFYDTFEPGDLRRGQVYHTPGSPPNPGNRINVGFLVGQQYNHFSDEPVKDRKGNPLIFTREVHQLEIGSNLEVTGIRPQKYVFDWTYFVELDNDWVYFRLPDVLLMKAEAIMRGGTATSAGPYGSTELELVNSIRLHPSRGASPLASINFDILLEERGRELWLECWRRQDLIRFGEFLKPFQEKDFVSDAKYLLFPIPNLQVAVNEYLTQNPGY
jgi:starch-binding outer membrane protein, SusD/RagB family